MRAFLPDFGLLLAGVGFAALFGFLSNVLLARTLGVEEFGIFSAAFTTVAALAPVVGAGVAHFWLSAIPAPGVQVARCVAPSIYLVGLVSFILAVPLLLFVIHLGAHSKQLGILVTILLPLLLAQGLYDLAHARFQIERRWKGLANWLMLPHLLRLIVAIAATGLSLNLLAVAVGYALVSLVVAAIAFSFLVTSNPSWVARNRSTLCVGQRSMISAVWSVAKGSFWFSGTAVGSVLYFGAPLLLLGWISNPRATGEFSAAFVLFGAAILVPTVLFQKLLLPKYHLVAARNPGELFAISRNATILTLPIAVAFSMFILLRSDNLVTFLYGLEYASAGHALGVLALALPVRYLSANLAAVISTGGFIRARSVALLFVLTCAVPAYIFVASIYGSAASIAWAFVAVEVVLLVVYWLVYLRYKREKQEHSQVAET